MFYLSQNKKLVLFSVLIFTVSLSTIMFFVNGPHWQTADSSQLLNSILSSTHGEAAPHGSAPVAEDEAFYRKILGSGNEDVAFFVIQKNGVFQYLNADFAKMLGYTPKDISDRTLSDVFSLVHPQDLGAFMQTFSSVLDTDANADIVIGPYRVRTQDGSYRVIVSEVKVYRPHADKPVEALVLTSQDFTDSVQKIQEVVPNAFKSQGKKIRQTEDFSTNRIMAERL